MMAEESSVVDWVLVLWKMMMAWLTPLGLSHPASGLTKKDLEMGLFELVSPVLFPRFDSSLKKRKKYVPGGLCS